MGLNNVFIFLKVYLLFIYIEIRYTVKILYQKGEQRMQHYPLIGIAGNHRQDETEHDSYLLSYTPNGFVAGLEAAGAIPVILPIAAAETAQAYISRVDALVLAGGQDVSPLLYGEEPHLKVGRTYPLRDAFEVALIEEAYRQRKPILAVCRGLQILNVAFGGTLYQDLESQNAETVVLHNQKTMPTMPTHTIQVASGSQLSKILGTKAVVNSYHHQAVKVLADKFKPVAWSSDGIIEAFESADSQQFVLAVQWHPETMIDTYDSMQSLFNHFVEQVKK